MLDNEELLFDELYEKTKDCGRTQFIKLLMQKERKNKELKEQLEEINKFIEKCGFVNIEQVMFNYCILSIKQKGFIKYLEKIIVDSKAGGGQQYYYQEILQKYKEIIGEDRE